MNKAQLIEALAERLEGDRKAAGVAVDSIVDVIVRTVNKGEKVNITGFGVFEKRARAARTARNPRTGESVKVKKTNVPAFRAGTTFREVVGGSRKLPKVSVARTSSARSSATAPTRPPAARGTSTRAATAVKTTARQTTGAAKPAATKMAQKAAKATAPKKETTTPKKTASAQVGRARASKKK